MEIVLDRKGDASAILMDMSKGFDTLNHDLLTVKLHAMGYWRYGHICHILEAKINRPNILKTKKLCKGEKVFLRSGFCLTSNVKAFLGFLCTGCININIMSIKNYNNKLNMVWNWRIASKFV